MRYLDAFDAWLLDPTHSNRQTRAIAFALLCAGFDDVEPEPEPEPAEEPRCPDVEARTGLGWS
jgi:hypothetical protein